MTETPLPEESIFAQALEITSAAERAAFLERSCRDNQALRAEVESLLRAQERSGDLLDLPENDSVTKDIPAREGRGTVIGPYKLLEPIGEGGMGTVWMAEQTHPIQRRVAVKVVKDGMDSRDVLARFEAERQALALMDHPNIAKVLDAGTTNPNAHAKPDIRNHDPVETNRRGSNFEFRASNFPPGRPFFVMELVKGRPITDYCDENRLGLRQRLRLFADVCRAVQHAHQKGIIHRDLKPSNVLVAPYDGKPVVKVIDFGVAKATGQRLTDKTLFTGFGALVGTPEYMSPEQAEINNQDVDTRSDIYSLGVLVYELLTGSTPLTRQRLRESALLEVLRVIREEEPPRPSTRLSELKDSLPSISVQRQLEPAKLTKLVRGELDWIVMKALEKDRNRRYETADAIAQDVDRYLADEPVLACPPSTWYRLHKLARRRRGLLATASVVAASLVAVAVLSVVYAQRQRKFAIDKADAARRITDLAGDLETSLAASNRLLAMRNFDRGQEAFDKNQIGQGLLWMIESWRSALAARDPAYQHAARANLAAWERQHPRLKAVLSHASPVDSAAFSPDGTMVITGSDDRTAQLWDATTGKPVGEPIRHDDVVTSVAFSPDGRTFLTCSNDNTARLWDAVTGHPMGATMQHQDQVLSGAFSPDGTLIVTGCKDNTARFWDASTGRASGSPLHENLPVEAVAFSPDGQIIVTVNATRGAQLWNAASRRPVGNPILSGGAQLRSVAFSPDGKTLLIGSQDHTVQPFDVDTRQPLASPQKRHSNRVRAVAFSPDGTIFISGSTDKTAQIWDAATVQPIGRPVQHEGPVVAVAFSRDGKTFLTVSSDSTVKLWDADPRQPVGRILVDETLRSTGFSPDGKTILTVNLGGPVRIRDAQTGRVIGPAMPDPLAWSVAISPDAKMLLAGGHAGDAQRWNPATGTQIGQPLPHPKGPIDVAFSPDGKTMITGGADHTIRLWNAASGAPLCKPIPQPGSVEDVQFSPEGKTFLAAYDSGAVQLWNLANFTPLGEPFPHPGCVSAAKFSPDGKFLATGCEDSMARIWDVNTHALLVPPLRHQGWVWDVAFSSDGTTLLTKSGDNAARLWDVATGVLIGPHYPHFSQRDGIAFDADDRSFFLNEGRRIRVFQTAPELPDDLERIATWVEVLTGLMLDPQRGTIRVLDNTAWLERRARLMKLGGPPETGNEEKFDPIRFGPDPTARARAWISYGRPDAAGSEFAELARARPSIPAFWFERGRFEVARGRIEIAAANFRDAIEHLPDNLGFRYIHVLSLLALGDRPGLRQACSSSLDRFARSTVSQTVNDIAWHCALVPDAIIDREAPVRLAKLAVSQAPAARKPMYMNTLGAALYRAGRFHEAISRLEEGIRLGRSQATAQDCVFLALAHHRLGHHAQSHSWLKSLQTYRPSEKPQDIWNELEIRLLRSEAESVILYDPAFPSDPFAAN